jgi:enamine deaminase RidA (YjgF/YER057c/UK114 family)
MLQLLQPQGWAKPNGYANGTAARGRMVFTSGQVGWDRARRFADTGLVGQVRQTLKNIVAVLAEAGARPEHIVRLTWYVINRDEYRACQAALGDAYREVLGNHYPAMAVVQVVGLMEEGARVEIEATAVIPE